MPRLLRKIIVILGIIGIYFLGIREIRHVIRDIHFGTILPTEYGEISNDVSFFAQSSVSITFVHDTQSGAQNRLYKIPFGMFFLFAMIGLASISASKKEYLFLVLIHFLGGMISFLFVLLGINYFVSFLIVPDLLSRYLIPLCSLGLVALTYVQDREAVKYEE